MVGMRTVDDRRQRLARLIDLARVYRGWTRTEIAKALDRDAGKLLPDSGNPKLDLVVGLADALDWTIGDVAEDLGAEAVDVPPGMDLRSLDREAVQCHRSGNWRGMIRTARQMMALANTAEERAVACNRAAGGFDGLGLFSRSLPHLQAGLAEPGLPEGLRLMLTVNLANAHYAMWHLVESRAASREVIDTLSDRQVEDRRTQVCRAFAHYVRGSSTRRLAMLDPERGALHASAARPDLQESMVSYEDLADTFADDRYAAMANTCRGAMIEVEVRMGHMAAREAIERLSVAVERVVDVEHHPPGDWLESWGWWCIFGCNVILHHLPEEELPRPMAIFSNKANEIAERLDNWSLRERAFSMELARRDLAGDDPWILDMEDIRSLVGTMGRFTTFRDRGYRILKSARLLIPEGGPRCAGA
ncbi:MAG: hypothetical protein ACO32J_03325 [Phycisphaerales bacterium]